MSQGERRLAAIMFTDIVGYTALTQSNERLAMQLLEKHRELIRPVLLKFLGREVKTIGDAFLVEFVSALEATECAVEMQKILYEFNQVATSRIQVRVGIHVGDVIHRDEDVYGDAVNIASRIEPLASAGGVCISEQVFDQVRNKIPYKLVKVQPKELKNVAFPIDVYKVELPWESGKQETEYDKRRLAILPLANVSADPNDDYFADGMTDELISTISSITGLTLIARTSVMRYKGQAKGIEEIGRELSVGTVLEGSVRKAGDRLRITVQLIDVPSQGHLWAQSYDREFDDIFAVQSDIAKRVAEALRVRMLPNETQQIEKRPTRSNEAFILYLKGRYYWNERTREGNAKAVRYFEKAIKLDQGFALPYAGLADCCVVAQNYGWQVPGEAFLRAKEYSLKAIALDPTLAEPHASLAAFKATYEYNWDEAEVELKRAMELKPSYATAYQWYSLQLWFRRRFDESYEQIRRASVLDPLSRAIGLNLGWGLTTLGRLKEAVDQFEKLIEMNPDYAFAHFYLGWTFYLQSMVNEGIEELRKAVGLSGEDPALRAELACMLGFAGRFGEANRIIDELKELSKTTYINKVKIAFALFGAGRTDEGFSYLEEGYQDRSDTILYFGAYPWFNKWREDPRWISIEKRLGLLHN